MSAAWAPMAYSERQAAIVMFFMAVRFGVKEVCRDPSNFHAEFIFSMKMYVNYVLSWK